MDTVTAPGTPVHDVRFESYGSPVASDRFNISPGPRMEADG
jgi:hypothetical protein